MRAGKLAELIFRHQSTRLVVIAIEALPPQLERAVSASSGRHGLCDPAFWISSNLFIDPLLQPLLISRGPALAAQRLAREVILRVRLDLVHRVIGEVGTDNLHARCRKVLSAKGAHSVMVLSALQHVKVPESSTRVGTTVTTGAGAFCPFILWEMLRQFVLLGVLDGHARDLVAAPYAIALGGRRRVCADAREDTSRRLVHQTVLIRHVLRKLRPDTDLLALLIALAPVITSGQAGRCIRIKVTGLTESIGVRPHLDGEVTVGIRLGVVHRRGVLSVFTLVPLGVDLDALQRLTGILDITETNLGLNNLLHGTGDGALLISLAWRVDGLILITTSCRSLSIRLVFLCIGNRSEGGCRSYCVDERAHHSNRERSGSKSSAAAAYSSTLYFLLVHSKKSFP